MGEYTLDGMPELSAWESVSDQRRAEVAERFNRRVVAVSSGCFIWTGAISTPDGYGRVMVTTNGVNRTWSAHRLACSLAGVTLHPGMVVDHRCNEPLCVRVHPEHVRVSSQSENLAYAVACGRAVGPRMSVDSSRRAERSRAVRELALSGWSQQAYDDLLRAFETQRVAVSDDQLRLF